jgi:nitroreductase
MVKQANTKHKILDVVGNRWSPRAFSSENISEEDLETILEAASWAPSAMNEQPWKYIYAHRGTPGFAKMVQCLLPGNQLWAKEAAVLIISVGLKRYEKTGLPNIHYLHDSGLANSNLVTQAFSQGIYSHLMGGFDKEKTINEYNLKESEDPICFIALGYLGNSENLPEPFKSRENGPRTRKSLDLIIKDGSYNS